MTYIQFLPIYQKRVWGGRNLETFLDRTLPEGVPIGESWDVVDRPEAQSVIAKGKKKGLTLRALLTEHSDHIMGPHWPNNKPFPILLKWLDCQERLSLQVHPPANIARELNAEPKTEMWYIAHCTKNASIIAGLKKGTTREAFTEALKDSTLEQYTHSMASEPGASLFVPSGRIHAIDAGNIILEIQENSDTTYRVYDWDRLGMNGAPRDLHIEKSLKSIDFQDFEPNLMKPHPGEQILAECRSFRVRKLELKPGYNTFQVGAGEGATLISVIKGSIHHSGTQNRNDSCINKGTTLLLPYAEHFSFEATESAIILVTDNFS